MTTVNFHVPGTARPARQPPPTNGTCATRSCSKRHYPGVLLLWTAHHARPTMPPANQYSPAPSTSRPIPYPWRKRDFGTGKSAELRPDGPCSRPQRQNRQWA